jgi:hypothetical protein
MILLGFKTILHKKCRSGQNSEGPAENSWGARPMSSKMKTNCKKSEGVTIHLSDLGSITFKCNRLHYNYFPIFMITLHYDYINFQM